MTSCGAVTHDIVDLSTSTEGKNCIGTFGTDFKCVNVSSHIFSA